MLYGLHWLLLVMYIDTLVTHACHTQQEEHVLHVWDTYIKPSQAKQVSFVAYGYGGVLVKRLLSTCSEEIGPRLGGIVFIESSHRVEDSDSAVVKQLLAEKAIYWEVGKMRFF